LKILRKKSKNSIPSSQRLSEVTENFKIQSITEKLYSGFELNNFDLETDEEAANNRKVVNKPKSKTMAQKKIERQTKAKIILELENKKDMEIEQTSKLVVNFIEKSNENDDVIKNDLKKQIKNINDKIKLKSTNIYLFVCFLAHHFFRRSGGGGV